MCSGFFKRLACISATLYICLGDNLHVVQVDSEPVTFVAATDTPVEGQDVPSLYGNGIGLLGGRPFAVVGRSPVGHGSRRLGHGLNGKRVDVRVVERLVADIGHAGR